MNSTTSAPSTWSPSTASAWRGALVAMALLGVVFTAGHLFGDGSMRDWDRWVDIGLLLVDLVALYGAQRRRRVEPSAHWRWVVVAVAGLTISQIFLVVGFGDWLGSQLLSPPDLAMFVWFGAMMRFLVLHLRSQDRWTRLVHLVESAMVTAAILFIVWETLLLPAVVDPSTMSLNAQVLTVLYPALDIFGASVLALLLLVDRSPARWLLFATFGFNAVGDIAAGMSPSYPTNTALWVAAPAWIVATLVLVAATSAPAGAGVTSARPRAIRLFIVSVLMAAAVWLATFKYVIGDTPTTVVSIVLGVAAGALWSTGRVADFLQSRSFADQLSTNIVELERTQEELRALLDDLPEAVVVIDRSGRIHEANRLVAELIGRAPDDVLGHYFVDLFSPSDRQHIVDLWRQMRAAAIMSNPTFTVVRPDGSVVYLEGDANLPIRDPERVVVALRNVTDRIRQTQALEVARERFELVFDRAPIGMAVTTLAERTVVEVNRRFAQMLGYTAEELVGRCIDDFIHPDDNARVPPVRDRAHLGATAEVRFICKDGSVVWTRLLVSIMVDTDGTELVVGHVEDVTEQRHSAEWMEWAATHDGLTGLPNRFRFLDTLGSLLTAAPIGSVAVLFIDLDNFKVINDSLGHEAGDQLLMAMSERLRAVVRDRDMLGRFGGDEFIVLLRDVSGARDPREVAERLRNEIAHPVQIEGAELYVTASIGITINDREGITTTEMMRDADAAMYRAKARGRDRVEIYSPGSHDASVLNLRTSNELRRGLERGEIVPYYQPVVQLDTGQLMGFEVLARWRHPDRGLIGPDQFLPMAEETGQISDLGSAVLRASLAQLGQWRNHSGRFADLSISVNVSVRQLMSTVLVDVVSDALAESGVSAAALWLEITETALMADVKAATVALRELRSLGLHLAVDDFGTGYSSLTYLKRFPVEAIKVDRSFVNGLGIDTEDSTIVEAVIKLGHSLNLMVVAEGVETPLQLSRLREIGCDRGQGYLFGRPRPAELIEREYSLA